MDSSCPYLPSSFPNPRQLTPLVPKQVKEKAWQVSDCLGSMLGSMRSHVSPTQVLMAYDAKDKKLITDEPMSQLVAEVGQEAGPAGAGVQVHAC